MNKLMLIPLMLAVLVAPALAQTWSANLIDNGNFTVLRNYDFGNLLSNPSFESTQSDSSGGRLNPNNVTIPLDWFYTNTDNISGGTYDTSIWYQPNAFVNTTVAYDGTKSLQFGLDNATLNYISKFVNTSVAYGQAYKLIFYFKYVNATLPADVNVQMDFKTTNQDWQVAFATNGGGYPTQSGCSEAVDSTFDGVCSIAEAGSGWYKATFDFWSLEAADNFTFEIVTEIAGYRTPAYPVLFDNISLTYPVLPADWYYIDTGVLNNSYPIYSDNAVWYSSIVLDNGLKFLTGYTDGGSNKWIEHSPVEMNVITNSTRRNNFYAAFNITATGSYGMIYITGAYDSTTISDAPVQILYYYNGTVTCTWVGSEGNIVIEDCSSSKNGNIIEINTTYTIDSSVSNYTQVQIFPLQSGTLDGNITVMGMSLRSESEEAPIPVIGTFALSPASGSHAVGTPFTINVTANSQGINIDGIDVLLTYDSGRLSVTNLAMVDGLTNVTFQNYTSSTITFSKLAAFGTQEAVNDTVATITFMPTAAGNASVNFIFTLGNTTDSNMAVNGTDMLNSTTNGVYEISETPPVVTIALPTGAYASGTTTVPLNFTVTDDVAVDDCWYKLNGGTNTTITSCENTTITNLTAGSYNLTVYANDTSSNVGSDITAFSISEPEPEPPIQGSTALIVILLPVFAALGLIFAFLGRIQDAEEMSDIIGIVIFLVIGVAFITVMAIAIGGLT